MSALAVVHALNDMPIVYAPQRLPGSLETPYELYTLDGEVLAFTTRTGAESARRALLPIQRTGVDHA